MQLQHCLVTNVKCEQYKIKTKKYTVQIGCVLKRQQKKNKSEFQSEVGAKWRVKHHGNKSKSSRSSEHIPAAVSAALFLLQGLTQRDLFHLVAF